MKTFKEIAEDFGKKEVKIIAKDKIKEWQTSRAVFLTSEDKWRRLEVKVEEDQRWFCKVIIEEILESIDMANKRIFIWENRLRVLNGGKDRSKIFDIDLIKQVPIGNLLGKSINGWGDKEWYRCPLHEERTPSFVWKKDTNRWYCFGACSENGDVIDLYSKMYGTSFKESCQILSKM